MKQAAPRRIRLWLVRHAQPLSVTVRLRAQEGQIIIDICDDGNGLANPRGRVSGGIDNMKTRARLISARFTIGPGRANRGTTVTVHLPFATVPDTGSAE